MIIHSDHRFCHVWLLDISISANLNWCPAVAFTFTEIRQFSISQMKLHSYNGFKQSQVSSLWEDSLTHTRMATCCLLYTQSVYEWRYEWNLHGVNAHPVRKTTLFLNISNDQLIISSSMPCDRDVTAISAIAAARGLKPLASIAYKHAVRTWCCHRLRHGYAADWRREA